MLCEDRLDVTVRGIANLVIRGCTPTMFLDNYKIADV
jgi:hypothetical protein